MLNIMAFAIIEYYGSKENNVIKFICLSCFLTNTDNFKLSGSVTQIAKKCLDQIHHVSIFRILHKKLFY